MEFGKLSPLYVDCEDGKPTLEQFVNEEEKKLIKRIFSLENKKDFTQDEKDKLEFLDKKLDIPLIQAILKPSFKSLKRLLDNNCKIIPTKLKEYVDCSYCAQHGHFKELKWARENNCRWDENTAICAARYGHLKILKWLRKNGCPWDEDVCSYAARNGYIDILRWARKNGCPWDEWTCCRAVENGNLKILKWVLENGCPWDEYVYNYCTRNGYGNIINQAKELGIIP